MEEFGIKLERAEKALEECQGSCRAVEPMIIIKVKCVTCSIYA
jgi:hypothetical protein